MRSMVFSLIFLTFRGFDYILVLTSNIHGYILSQYTERISADHVNKRCFRLLSVDL